MPDDAPKREAFSNRGEVGRLIEIIAQHYVFDASAYPNLAGADQSHIQMFGVKHCALHLAKLAGQVAALSEHADHTNALALDDVKAVASKTLINALKLADLAGMSDIELIASIEQRYDVRREDNVRRVG